MKQYIVIALGSLWGLMANAQDVIYVFDAPCATTCNNPGPDCPGVGTPSPSFINTTVIGSASAFTVSPSLNLGTANCSSPVFSTSMNGFAAGNPGNPSRARWASGWTTSATANANHYFTATLTAATFADVSMTQITFDESRSGTGPRMCQVMVSVDGGPFTLLWQGVIPDNTSWRPWSITSFTALAPMPTFNNTLTVRFQGYTSEAATGSWRIDNVRFFAGIVNLPIELTSFTGHAEDAGVELDWTTATELSNDYFTVYRLQSDSSWREVGRVAGAGNSQNTRSYSLMDMSPHAGTNYYKLRQTDTDGQYEEFDVIAVEWKPPDKPLAYPNPSGADGPVYLLRDAKSVMVSDAAGRFIPSELSGKEIRFDGPPGKYFILVVPLHGNAETIEILRQ